MAVKISRWQSYLQVIQSREEQRVEQFQKAENVLLIVLEKVNAMDPRFIVDYSRNLEALEFALSAAEDEVAMEVPLCIDADALLVQECSGEQNDAEKVIRGDFQMPGSCYLGVPKDGTPPERWTKEDVFSAVGSTDASGHIVPGKVLQLLKELIVAAIVHCQRQFLIKPGTVRKKTRRNVSVREMENERMRWPKEEEWEGRDEGSRRGAGRETHLDLVCSLTGEHMQSKPQCTSVEWDSDV